MELWGYNLFYTISRATHENIVRRNFSQIYYVIVYVIKIYYVCNYVCYKNSFVYLFTAIIRTSNIKSSQRKSIILCRFQNEPQLSKVLFVKNENKSQQERHALPRTGFLSNFSTRKKKKNKNESNSLQLLLFFFTFRLSEACTRCTLGNRRQKPGQQWLHDNWLASLFFPSPLLFFHPRVHTEPKETECFPGQEKRSQSPLFFLPSFLLFLILFYFIFFLSIFIFMQIAPGEKNWRHEVS